MVFREIWAMKVLDGSKTMEVRSMRLSPQLLGEEMYMGSKGFVYARIYLGEPIEFRSLELQLQ